MKKILSLGMGVQTTALYYMSCLDDCERPDLAIFADTGAEHPGTLEHLEILLEWQRQNDGVPVRVISVKNILADIRAKQNSTGQRWASIPAFAGKGKMRMRRQCTSEYKINQVITGLRDWYGLKKGQWLPTSEMWLGITLDEAHRMKPSQNPRIVRAYPLIDLNFTRHECAGWLEKHGFKVPPKSACIICPFKSDHSWRQLKQIQPEEFKKAVEIDRTIRDMSKHGIVNPIYLHRSCEPLDAIEFKSDLFDSFGNECEGICGT